MSVKDIRRDHIQRMKGDYISEDHSRSTVNNVLSIIPPPIGCVCGAGGDQ